MEEDDADSRNVTAHKEAAQANAYTEICMLGIGEAAETFQDGDPFGEELDKVTQVLPGLIPCCKETRVSESHAGGHVSCSGVHTGWAGACPCTVWKLDGEMV